MACLLPTTTSTRRPGKKENLTFTLLRRNLNLSWSRLTKNVTGAKKKPTTTTLNLPKSQAIKKPKELLVMLSNNFRQRKKVKHDNDDDEKDHNDFGDGGLWQRGILMGDKCQPLDFSGVIYYDMNGKPLSELPMKSPRAASPLPTYFS